MIILPFKTPINFAKVDNILYRSSQPNENELRYLKDNFKITDIINLSNNSPKRATENEKSLAKLLNINYESIPSATDLPAWEKIKMFVNRVNELKKIPESKVLVHCNAGIDRTGTYVLFYQLMNKLKTYNDAVKEMISMGHIPEFHPKLLPRIKEIAIKNKLL